MSNSNIFNFDIPLQVDKSLLDSTKDKNDNKSEEKRIIKGFASTEDIDETGEKVLQEGLDISYFLKQGFINYQHKLEPEYIIGVPIKAEINKAFYLEGELFKGRPVADSVWELATTLEKENVPRKLGLSIQGRVLEREDNVIKKAIIHMVSVTPIPANPNSLAWAEIAKAIVKHQPIEKELMAGYATSPETQSNGGALRLESLETKLKDLDFGSVFSTLKKINTIKKTFKDYIYNTPNLDYQDENLLESLADYFVYVSLLSTDSVDDAIDILNSLINELK